MTREQKKRFLERPARLLERYRKQQAEVEAVKNNVITGIRYEGIRVKEKAEWDLSSFLAKYEQEEQRLFSLMSEHLEAASAAEDAIQGNPRWEILFERFILCYSYEQMADRHNVNERTIYRWIDEGLDAMKI